MWVEYRITRKWQEDDIRKRFMVTNLQLAVKIIQDPYLSHYSIFKRKEYQTNKYRLGNGYPILFMVIKTLFYNLLNIFLKVLLAKTHSNI